MVASTESEYIRRQKKNYPKKLKYLPKFWKFNGQVNILIITFELVRAAISTSTKLSDYVNTAIIQLLLTLMLEAKLK